MVKMLNHYHIFYMHTRWQRRRLETYHCTNLCIQYMLNLGHLEYSISSLNWRRNEMQPYSILEMVNSAPPNMPVYCSSNDILSLFFSFYLFILEYEFGVLGQSIGYCNYIKIKIKCAKIKQNIGDDLSWVAIQSYMRDRRNTNIAQRSNTGLPCVESV